MTTTNTASWMPLPTGEGTKGNRKSVACGLLARLQRRSARAVVLALAAPVSGLAVVLGPLGMLVALVAHVKGHRLGMAASVLAGVMTIVGMSITLYLR